MTISVKSSLNLPPPSVIEHDIGLLRESLDRCRDAIRRNRKSVENQRMEQAELLALVDNPGRYNSDACQKAADRCDKHIRMFEALNEKEDAKVEQIGGMIRTLEQRKCLSEQMLQSTGKKAPE